MSKIAEFKRATEDTDLGEASIYERLRDDIIQGRFVANERLKVSELAERMGTSTNPVREALQQLRGEGFVVMMPNRGARVRTIDETFVRDIFEIEVLIEPALTRWFVGLATKADLDTLEDLQAQMEILNFADQHAHSKLDMSFHQVMYDRHYNRHAVDLWWRHREILSAISRQFPTSLSRQTSVVNEHRGLLQCIKKQDADGAAAIIAQHVEGSGRHIIEHMRLIKRRM
ncbi:UNVERIFIED_ORG: DNA-binding GntR family transcriptional regulator [Agrobacterium larrymoorei]|uniref:GntR family transcriptional regulator n=1 Tax=Agrobacterium cavarae TaxID=2528239 RepID=UPI000715ECD4|nr:GntR family transcriptional regulator [Agrobacterium cavarae]KQZ95244.1 GntR family transcriptional regulator [Rhizobium sp. Root564]MDP9573393.1 DNA-binding GntR family transcriptional regulator [Agrobacterium larrymoorei]